MKVYHRRFLFADTRCSNYKLLKLFTTIYGNIFTARIVNMWNSLPVVDGNSVNAFKARLDKFWLHQEVMFDFTADHSGTGNRSDVVKFLLVIFISPQSGSKKSYIQQNTIQ